MYCAWLHEFDNDAFYHGSAICIVKRSDTAAILRSSIQSVPYSREGCRSVCLMSGKRAKRTSCTSSSRVHVSSFPFFFLLPPTVITFFIYVPTPILIDSESKSW